MKLINQSAKFIKQEPGLSGIYKAIELAGRTSYLSWDKMTDESAKKFVDMLIKSKHMSCLEHGTVYLKLPPVIDAKTTLSHSFDYDKNPYSKIVFNGYDADYATTNLRVLLENNWMEDLRFLCEPTEFHEKRLSVKVVTSRSVSHELVRHRSMSFIQESQRYVGYDKDKFGGEITCIIPSWMDVQEGKVLFLPDTWHINDIEIPDNPGYLSFIEACKRSEFEYLAMINDGLKPQEAREVLPNATKTTLVITAFESDWREWFAQRLFGKTGQPHPDMVVLANLIKEEFEKAGVWEEIMKYPSKYE